MLFGKDKKGLFPATVSFPTDLHAIGQFIQDGNPIVFETLLHFKEILDDYQVQFDDQNDDQLNYLMNYSFNEINTARYSYRSYRWRGTYH